ncbi:hypothetical protein WN48_03863 [Eufriesea mexicana]|nr:hypothetical protein WN48_03863 [Eufriesea mexicana]
MRNDGRQSRQPVIYHRVALPENVTRTAEEYRETERRTNREKLEFGAQTFAGAKDKWRRCGSFLGDSVTLLGLDAVNKLKINSGTWETGKRNMLFEFRENSLNACFA